MSHARKVLLGFATAWPVVYLALFTRPLVAVALAGFIPPPELVTGSLAEMAVLFAIHLGTLLLLLALGVYYVRDAWRSPRIPEDRRVVWVVLTIAGGFLAQIPYWYLFIWREPGPPRTTRG